MLLVVTLFPSKRAQLKISLVQEDSWAAQLVLSMSIFSSVIASFDHRPLPRFVYQSSVSFPPTDSLFIGSFSSDRNHMG